VHEQTKRGIFLRRERVHFTRGGTIENLHSIVIERVYHSEGGLVREGHESHVRD